MTEIGPTSTTRKNIVITTLLFCWAVIIYCIIWGDPANSLHTSALAWSFATSFAVIGAYVFGAVWDNITLAKTAPK